MNGPYKTTSGKEFITGVDRVNGEYKLTHLYYGDFNDLGDSLCPRGWNRGDGYSILRNNISKKGICKKCIAKAESE